MVKNGNYTLRASPVGGPGGMYATGNGTFQIVTVAAQVPDTFDRQTWKITAVEGKEDIYTIVLLQFDEGIILRQSWSLENRVDVPSGPIIGAEVPDQWHITGPVHNDVNNAYRIAAVSDVVGVNFYVGTNPEEQVVIKPIPFHPPPPPGEIPYWQFNEL